VLKWLIAFSAHVIVVDVAKNYWDSEGNVKWKHVILIYVGNEYFNYLLISEIGASIKVSITWIYYPTIRC